MAVRRPHRSTADDYLRMGETGILGEDDRVELIDRRIPEYWVVDLDQAVVAVHRAPHGQVYTDVRELTPGTRLAPQAVPDVELGVAEILGA